MPVRTGPRLAAALALTLTACTGGDPVADRDDLRTLPSLEEQSATYEQMVTQFEQRLEGALGVSGWSTAGTASSALCGEGEVEGAQIGFLPTRLLTGGVPDDRWA